jgi:hypothetical protein
MHYVMTCEGQYPIRPITGAPDLVDLGTMSWWLGRKITTPIPEPLVYRLDTDIDPDINTPGNPIAMYDEEDPPVMREDLKAALWDAGVDNIDFYKAIVKDPLDGKELTNYWAFNVLGLVSCADMNRSKLMGTSQSQLLDVDFDSLVIDEKATMGFSFFRMAENISAIIVSDRVKETIERHKIPGMVFYSSGQWSG